MGYRIGLINVCVYSIISKSLDNLIYVSEPMEPLNNPVLSNEGEDEFNSNVYKHNARRQFFVLNSKQDGCLTTLHLQFYKPIIRGMI